MDSLEKAGRVARQFGRQGELIIALYDTFPEDFDMEEPLFADMDSLTVPLFLDKFERRGMHGALVRFVDLDTAARSAELLGKELYTRKRGEQPDDDEIYFEDLTGFGVSFDDDPRKGVITSYIDNDNNPLFEVLVEGKGVYIPATEEMISALDVDSCEIEFSLPQGLLDLYM